VSGAIDFYFDFASPFGYIMSEHIDAVAAKYGRVVVWRAMLLGPAFKVSGTVPVLGMPVKGEYFKIDFARSARYHGVAFRLPSRFPLMTTLAARAFMWVNDRDPAKAKQLAHAIFRAYFVDDVNIAEEDKLPGIAAAQGLDRHEIGDAIHDIDVKNRLRALVDAAIARGVFGSPMVYVDGEPFWGTDRLPHVEKWLATGGF
jgi:2-hydroxychromene-2-carboxylate isomerase